MPLLLVVDSEMRTKGPNHQTKSTSNSDEPARKCPSQNAETEPPWHLPDNLISRPQWQILEIYYSPDIAEIAKLPKDFQRLYFEAMRKVPIWFAPKSIRDELVGRIY